MNTELLKIMNYFYCEFVVSCKFRFKLKSKFFEQNLVYSRTLEEYLNRKTNIDYYGV